MPQLLLIAIVGGVAWLGYKAIKKEMARVGKVVREADEQGEKQVAELEQDPETGVYRPKE